MAFSTIPSAAAPHIKPNSTQPSVPRSVTRVIGVYVPAISRNMVTWSITRITCFAFSLVMAWYKVDIVYKIISAPP